MSDPKSTFRFRKYVSIGALAAEQDDAFLQECFVDTGLLGLIQTSSDYHRILLGRTGSGKSALFLRLEASANAFTINPDELALDHLSNSDLLKELHDCGISLSPFYKLLWKHVFVVEVLRYRHHQLTESKNASGWFRSFLDNWPANPKGRTLKEAMEYLTQYGDALWHTTDVRIQEITQKIEEQLAAKVGAKLGDVGFTFGGGAKESEERRTAVEEIGREFVKAIQIKKLNDAVRGLAEDMDGQPPLYVIVDGLDRDWTETKLRYELIRALIDTSLEFKVVTNVKVLIALRQDLYEALITATAEPGFQSEKYNQLCLPVLWTRGELIELVNARVNKLIRGAYTKDDVQIDDIVEQVSGQPGVQYLIDRTLMRPRDLIDYFNHCIARTDGSPKITRRMILDAEASYSSGRLQAIADEWSALEPALLDVAEILRGKRANIKMQDISEDEVTAACRKWYVKHWNARSPIVDSAKRHGEGESSETAVEVRRQVVNLLYKVGIIGVKTSPTEGISWSFEDVASIDSLELPATSSIRIHKMFWRALGIVGIGTSE